MIQRSILTEAQFALKQFRALCITGPRQSGKTTLSRQLFKNKPYVNFEDPGVQMQFQENPVHFLQQYKGGAIFDEVQRVPDLFRHLQVLLDTNTKRGQFILTGSNNFLLQQQVSQSLAGRAGYLHLLPLSYDELKQNNIALTDINKTILTGGYPEIWAEGLNAFRWQESYIQTYVQKDIRQITNVGNLAAFNKLLQLCANQAGQPINRNTLATQVGVDTKTIQSWLGILESSFILFQLQPWHNNLNKRIIKSPKLYFYDTGLLCTLLNIKSKEGLQKHSQYGFIFENWCIAEIKKNQFNNGLADRTYFFRDSARNEVDLIVEKESGPLAIEIKSKNKIDSSLLVGLKYWQRNQPGAQGVLLYQGPTAETGNPLLHWHHWKDINQF